MNVHLAKAAKESVHDKLEPLVHHDPKGANQKTGSTFAPLSKAKVRNHLS